MAFFRDSVDFTNHGKGANRTGQIPGLIADTPFSPEFDTWLENVELRWAIMSGRATRSTPAPSAHHLL